MHQILIIEDLEDIREITQEILDLEGFKTLAASNGVAGVQLAQKHRPDLIFCDLLMPELDGFGVLEALANDPSTDSIPVVMLTALCEEISGHKALEIGASDYLTKPFLRSDLLGAVNDCVL